MIHDSEMERLYEWFGSLRPLLNKGFINNTPVSDDAKMLIDNYSGFLSININIYLRKQKNKEQRCPNKDFLEYLLNKALNEAGSFRDNIVYRMDNPGIDFKLLKLWYQNRIGQVICFPNFLSTSKEKWSNNDKIFKIHTTNSSRGKDLMPIIYSGKAEWEKEVLFKSRSKFKIISIKDDYIELREVPQTTQNFTMIYDNTYINDPDIEKALGLDETDEEDYEESFLEKYG